MTRLQQAHANLSNARDAYDDALESSEHDRMRCAQLRSGDYVVGFARFVDHITRDGGSVTVHWCDVATDADDATWTTPATYETDVFRSD